MICTAYEQGYGDGFHGKPKNNPYEQESDLNEAWNIGFDAGREAVKDINTLRGEWADNG